MPMVSTVAATIINGLTRAEQWLSYTQAVSGPILIRSMLALGGVTLLLWLYAIGNHIQHAAVPILLGTVLLMTGAALPFIVRITGSVRFAATFYSTNSNHVTIIYTINKQTSNRYFICA
jgi:hypothetical protein